MENHAINGTNHYFDCDWAIFQFANCNKLPEGKFVKPCQQPMRPNSMGIHQWICRESLTESLSKSKLIFALNIQKP